MWPTHLAIPGAAQELGLGPLPPMHQVLRGVLLDSAPNGAVSHEACVQSLVQSVAAVVSLALASDHDGSEEGRKEAELRSRRAVGAIIGGQSVVKRWGGWKNPDISPDFSEKSTIFL